LALVSLQVVLVKVPGCCIKLNQSRRSRKALVQKSAWSETEVAHTRHWIFYTVWPRASHAPRGRRRLSHTRAIFKPRRAPKPSRSIAAAEPIEYSAEYSRFNPSELPDAHNWFVDRFTLFLTQFQQSQTDSLLFWAFRIDLQCPFCQIQLTEGDIVIPRTKWLQKMHIHSSRS
jgi:hypothetical protein